MEHRHLYPVPDPEGGAVSPALPGSAAGSEDEWIREAQLLRVQGDALTRKTDEWRYAVGDWWNRGERYGGRRKIGAAALGMPYGTVGYWAAAARVVPIFGRPKIGVEQGKVISSVPAQHRERYMEMAVKMTNRELKDAKIAEFGSARGNKTKAKVKDSTRKEKRKAELAEVARSRAAIREHAYSTMQGAPPGAQNNPMFWRAAKVEALINELRSIEPEVAAGQLVSPAFRYFTAENRQWWDRFVTACEKRLADELPGEKPLKRHPVQAQWAESGLDARDK